MVIPEIGSSFLCIENRGAVATKTLGPGDFETVFETFQIGKLLCAADIMKNDVRAAVENGSVDHQIVHQSKRFNGHLVRIPKFCRRFGIRFFQIEMHESAFAKHYRMIGVG